MELFVFSEVSNTCGTGIKFPHTPTSLVHFDLNKLLLTAGPRIFLPVPSFPTVQAWRVPTWNFAMSCMWQNLKPTLVGARKIAT